MATTRGLIAAVVVIGTGLVALHLRAQGPSSIPAAPDHKLTPGAVAVTSTRELCASGFNQRPRAWHNKVETLAKYGLPASMTHAVEDDDLIPRCLGGDNASPLNHWPMSCTAWSGTRCLSGPARIKDLDEAKACRAACLHMDDAYTQQLQAKFSHWPEGFPLQ
jgi:hypothetical protein